jgi:hypothetical protein
LWDEPKEGKHAVEQLEFTLVSLRKRPTRLTLLLSQKSVTMIFTADGILMNLFFLGDVVCCFSIKYVLDSGSKWWTQMTSQAVGSTHV